MATYWSKGKKLGWPGAFPSFICPLPLELEVGSHHGVTCTLLHPASGVREGKPDLPSDLLVVGALVQPELGPAELGKRGDQK